MFAVVAFSGCATVQPVASSGVTGSNVEPCEQTISAAINEQDFFGSVLVMQDGETLYQNTYGYENFEEQVRTSDHTRY